MRTLRTAATAATTLAIVVALATPAWAGSSFSDGEVEASAEGEALQLVVTEPEVEGWGGTRTVEISAPKGFAITSCDAGAFRPCTGEGRNWTATRSLATGDWSISLTVSTPATNGTYAFGVTQQDAEDATPDQQSAPQVTVVNGQDPPPPTVAPSPTTTPRPTPSARPSPSPAPSPSPSAEDDDAAGPTTSRGSSGGTSLDVTPRRTGPGADQPAVAGPGPTAADDPDTSQPATSVVAPTPGASTTAAGEAAAAGEAPPWQQLVGGALLLVGLGIVGVRRLRAR